MRILVVEDEIELCAAIAEGLAMNGYAVDCCHDGAEACEMLDVEPYDLAILDLNLPGMDGLDVLRNARAENSEIKILILSARGTVSDRVRGLELGANDYLVKPFAFEELEARVKGLLRRRFVQAESVLHLGALALDTDKRTATVQGLALSLTKKEFGILEYLMLNPGRVISKEELIEHVWNCEADSFSNAIRVHIATLRKKLSTALGRELLCTKIGEGYFLAAQEADHA